MVRLITVVAIVLAAIAVGDALWQRYHCHVAWTDVQILPPIPYERTETIAAEQEKLRAMACQYPYRGNSCRK